MNAKRVNGVPNYAMRVFSVLLAVALLVPMLTVGLTGVKVRAAQDDCTVKLDPMYMLTACSLQDARIKRQAYHYDDTDVMAYQENAATDVTFTFRLPYAVNEFKMTGVECEEDKYADWRFHGFEVSADGETWINPAMEKSDYTYVATHTDASDCTIGGLTFYGAAETAFRYVRVTMGKDWIPGISWFYIPEGEADLPNKVDPANVLVKSELSSKVTSAQRQGSFNVGGYTPGESVKAFVVNGTGMYFLLKFDFQYAVKEVGMTAISYIFAGTGKEYENDAGDFAFRGYEVSADGETWTQAKMLKGPYVYSAPNNTTADIGSNIYYISSDEPFRYLRLNFSHAWLPGIGYFYLPDKAVASEVNILGPDEVVAGSQTAYKAQVLPQGAPENVAWSVESSEPAYAAAVDQNGVFSAYNPGTYTLKAVTQDGTDIVATKTVTVVENTAAGVCTVKVDPASADCYMGASVSGATVRREGTYTYDGVGGWEYTGINISQKDAYMTFKLPRVVNKLKMTAIELAETSVNFADYHFKKFQVSADGVNWTDLTVQRFGRELATTTKEHPEADRRYGVTLYGESEAPFRYIRVYYPRDWLPGLCYFYLPEAPAVSEVNILGPDKVVAGSQTAYTAQVLPQGALENVVWSVEGRANWFEAYLDANGTFFAYNPGTYTLKATAQDGSGVVGEKTVTVVKNTVADACSEKLTRGEDYTVTSTVEVGFAADKTYTVDGVNPLSYYGSVAGMNAALEIKLPRAVNQVKMTVMEITEPSQHFENYHIKKIEVSNDGEIWTDLSFQRMYRDFAGGRNDGDYVLRRIGQTLYGSAEEEFQYVRVYIPNAWTPGLCNVYIPAEKAPEVESPLANWEAPQLRLSDESSIRFGFNLEASGIAYDAGDGSYEAAREAGSYVRRELDENSQIVIDGKAYVVKDFGAVLTASKNATADALSCDATGISVSKVSAKNLYDVQDGVVSFTAVVVNIPENMVERTIYARSYVAYEVDGAVQYLYGDVMSTTLQALRDAYAGI